MARRKNERASDAIDCEIDRIYRENCSGIQIDIFDIPRVFDAGRKARTEGRDMKEAIVSFVASIAK
jgi:hypothetical protein